ncbi:hypothetical protein I3843_07G051000 [Carya illinoinensis]|nr:hypothetical protein I3843_07G050900 [Carya illinoinensis]KAG7969815.1 hypothetical protein I3843_07G051000 [Carya illinoinensis]
MHMQDNNFVLLFRVNERAAKRSLGNTHMQWTSHARCNTAHMQQEHNLQKLTRTALVEKFSSSKDQHAGNSHMCSSYYTKTAETHSDSTHTNTVAEKSHVQQPCSRPNPHGQHIAGPTAAHTCRPLDGWSRKLTHAASNVDQHHTNAENMLLEGKFFLFLHMEDGG